MQGQRKGKVVSTARDAHVDTARGKVARHREDGRLQVIERERSVVLEQAELAAVESSDCPNVFPIAFEEVRLDSLTHCDSAGDDLRAKVVCISVRIQQQLPHDGGLDNVDAHRGDVRHDLHHVFG